MIQTAYSTQESVSAAVAELKQQCGAFEPRVVVAFASPKYDPAALSRELKDAFPSACVGGCTTAGEIVSSRMLTGSVVAMFLDGLTVTQSGAAVVRNLKAGGDVGEALASLEAQFGAPLSTLDIQKYAGIVLIDGMSGAEERVLEKLGDKTDLMFVGGSAGDDLKFEGATVFLDGSAYQDAALLMLFRLPKGFEIIKTQSFLATEKVLAATEVDEAQRKVIQFNGKPAVTAYAEAVGVAPEDAAQAFMVHPLGLMIDGEPYVRSPQRVQEDSIVFYCQIHEGSELQVLTGTDIVGDTRAAVEAKKAQMGDIAAIIDFHCILRTLGLRANQQCDEYPKVFGETPVVGFSTYGEAFLGHINQTSTMLALR